MLDERRHNYPKGFQEKPWCPNTELVQICASLAGIELTSEKFCTETIENARSSEGIAHWLESADFYPAASCVDVNRRLVRQLEVVNEKADAPSNEDTLQKIDGTKDLSVKLEAFEAYKKAQEKYEKRQTIVDRWRRVIFETSVSTTEDKENKHFRRFESESQLSETEVVDKVIQFLSALNKITGVEPHTIDLSCGKAKNCPQTPIIHHLGKF